MYFLGGLGGGCEGNWGDFIKKTEKKKNQKYKDRWGIEHEAICLTYSLPNVFICFKSIICAYSSLIFFFFIFFYPAEGDAILWGGHLVVPSPVY